MGEDRIRMLEWKEMKSVISDILNGKRSLEESFKFGMVIEMTRVVHIVLLIIFAYMQIMPAFLYQLFSICWYSVTKQQIIQGKYMVSFYMSYLEIMANTCVMTYLVGRACGFPLYNMLIVPLAFYMCYMLEGTWNRFVKPLIFGSLSFLEFVLMYVWSDTFTGHYQLDGRQMDFFYILNTFVVCVSMLSFVTCFVMEINGKQYALQQQNTELEKLANFDPLTGLRNRRSMLAHIKECQQEHREFTIILGDIDDFKKVNDTYGHDCGDSVLRKVAQVIKENCTMNCVSSRWGGEEFLILVSGTLEEGVNIAEAIRNQIATSFLWYEGKRIPCTMTFGIASYQQGEAIEKTTSRADKRLYYGKSKGKNCVVSQDEE